jgi:hypothetical protein
MDLIKTPPLKYNKNNHNNFHSLFNNKTLNLNPKQLKFQLNKILNQKMHLYFYFIQQVGQELLPQLYLHRKYSRILWLWPLHYLQ